MIARALLSAAILARLLSPTIAAAEPVAHLAPASAGPPAAPALTDAEWERREHNTLFWTGAGLLVGSLAVAAGGVYWYRQDGKVACSAPPGAVCERLYETKVQGVLTVASAVGLALGGIGMMVLYRDRGTTVSLSPTGLAGRF